jgi:hypothetical protein
LPEPINPDAVSPAPQEAAAVLLEIDMHADMPGLEKVTAGGGRRADPISPALAAPPEPAQQATDLTTDLVDERLAASNPAEPAGFDTTPPDQPPSPASSDTAAGDTQAAQLEPATPASTAALLLAAAPPPQPAALLPQLSHSDPLAALKAMSEFELIALFS